MPDDFTLNPEGKKELNANDIDEMRGRLVDHYGTKILGKPNTNWTAAEIAAQLAYKHLTNNLYELAPGMKVPDQISQLYIRNGVSGAFGLLRKYAARAFLAILVILAILAFMNVVFK